MNEDNIWMKNERILYMDERLTSSPHCPFNQAIKHAFVAAKITLETPMFRLAFVDWQRVSLRVEHKLVQWQQIGVVTE